MIRAFRALRYAGKALEQGWPALVSQPYDKISPEMRDVYASRSPYNVVHLIRGERRPDDTAWHAEAAARMRAWLGEGALVRDDEPALFVYTQTFRDARGRELVRTGVTGVFDLAHRDRVRHHERTHAGPRADRRRLLDATGCDLGQVFLLRHAGPKFSPKLLRKQEAAVEVSEDDGVVHRFARLADGKAVRALEELYANSRFLIADGHHRFTVACQHADEAGGDGMVLVTCVDLEDEGLVVMPTHRVLAGLAAAERARLLRRVLELGVEARPFGPTAAAFVDEVAGLGPGAIGIVLRGGGYVWRPDYAAAGSELERLDVHRLETELLADFVGEEGSGRLRYARDGHRAAADVLAHAADAAFLLAPVTPRRVADVAEGGENMPPKSTDFFPKMLSGFVFHDTGART